MSGWAAVAAVALFAVLSAASNAGWLPKRRSGLDYEADAALAERTIDRLKRENAELNATRSLEPILEQLHTNAELQAQVLERLVHHNGSFKHMEGSLAEIHDGLKTMTGFIAGLHGMQLHSPASSDVAN